MPELTAYTDVVNYAAKDTEHAHQTALCMWLRHAAWDNNPKQLDKLNSKEQYEAIRRSYIWHPRMGQYAGFGPVILDVADLIFAIPNGGARDRITASRLRDEGVRPGVADLFLPMPRHYYIADGGLVVNKHGLFLEMKRPKSARGRKGVASDAQKLFAERVTAQGYEWALGVDWHAGIIAVWDYLYSMKD